jgi:hypothetical protein
VINNLCQSVDFPTPFGAYTLTIHAGDDPSNPVKASNLFISMSDLKAQTATFNNINIGVAAGQITKGPVDPTQVPKDNPAAQGSFAQEADSADLTGVQQTAWATSASTFSLNGMHLSLDSGSKGCF